MTEEQPEPLDGTGVLDDEPDDEDEYYIFKNRFLRLLQDFVVALFR